MPSEPAELFPVVVALDYASADAARQLVHRLGPAAVHYKVGLELLTAAGPELVRELVDAGKQVFLDLKLHEIPNSVAGAVRAAGELGACLVTVHASAGSAVLRAAVRAAEPFPNLRVLGLTVITSLGDADLPEIGLAPSVLDQVRRLALLAADSGCHGVIASPGEASMFAPMLPRGSLIVTPGIRLAGTASHDQSRVTTPEVAASAGATHIIVGRAVTAAPDPAAAFDRVASEFLRHKRVLYPGSCLQTIH